jgi:hypothetical protein
MEKIKDVLNTKFPISLVGIVWIIAILVGTWGYADQRFATKAEVCEISRRYEADIKDIKEDLDYLVRLHIK